MLIFFLRDKKGNCRSFFFLLMHFSRFCSFSGEDFACEEHEYVRGGAKKYIDCTNYVSACIPCKTPLRRFVGYFGHTCLVSVNRLTESVCNFLGLIFEHF
jgi:hypothetical protein